MITPRPFFSTFLLLCLTSSAAMAEISFAGGDGSSKDSAILIIGATDESSGVASEYDWIKTNRAEAVILQQKLLQQSSKVYDVMIIKTGTQKEEIYFDITDFYGDL